MTIDRVSDGTIYLSGDVELENQEIVLEKQGQTGKTFVKKTNIEGIYTFGIEQTVDNYFGHGPGYIWYSRASVMNAAFGTTLYEAAYRCGDRGYRGCAVDLVRFEQLLKEAGYSVDFTPYTPEWEEGIDVRFRVTKDKE